MSHRFRLSAPRLAGTLITLLLVACAGTARRNATPPPPQPPVAAIKPYAVPSPNGARNDNYYWLRDDTRTNADLLAYLKAENDYYAAMSERTKPLEDKLYGEIVGRIKQDDASVPFLYRHYWYYTRYEEGHEYPIYARRREGNDASEQVMVDANKQAEGHDFYNLGDWEVSPSGQLLAYAEDTVGRRQYTVHVKDLKTGQVFPDELPNTNSSFAWADDNKTLFYVEDDPVTLLSVRVKKHVLGTDTARDTLVYEEPDHSYYISVGRTGDDKFLAIYEQSTLSTEMRYISAGQPGAKFKVFAPRERDHEYEADHIAGRWIVRTNWQARNFRLAEVGDAQVGDKARWRALVPANDAVFISGFALFKNYLAVGERSEGLQRIRIKPWKGGKESYVKSDEPAYVATLGVNREQNTDTLRYNYSSLTTPVTVYDLSMKSGDKVLKKRDPVIGDFDPANYVTERVWIDARDGTKIPVSLVYHKGFKKDGTAPLYQYAYGSYGSSTDPYFSSPRLSLLDRGFVYAIAHIRGGQEMGRAWYENGKLLKKTNTFTDFVDVTEGLVKQGWAAKDKVFAMGASAGGLLMGAVANLAPQDYRAIVAHVPFVDVVTTMLDESIPLTTNEFDEWGNPKEKVYYDYMLSYSPYDNVRAQNYPAMLVTTGLWDSQVQYWEPAKYVARLRDLDQGKEPVVFRINMEAGHGGKSGRFRRYREQSEMYAFMLERLGLAGVQVAAK